MAENYGTLEGTLDEHGVLSGEMSDRATLEGEIQFGSGGGGVLDVFQNGQSVVQGRYAYVTVPTFLRELRSDDYHNTVTSLEMQIWNGKADPDDIPTALSQLDNDANYVQDADYVHTDNNFTDEDKAAIGNIPENITDLSDVAVDNIQNGQILKWDATQEKFVNANESGGGSGDVADVKVNDTSVVDENGVANIDLSGYAETTDIHNPTITIQKNGQNVDTFTLNQTTDKIIDISVPTKTSDLQNDSSFITNTVNNLANYYLKSQTYTQTEVDALIDAAINGRFQKVNVLPATGEPNVIYLVPKATPETSNACDEYIWQDNAWELIGSTDIDLSGYVTDEELNTALADYLTTSAFNTAIANYYTKTEVGNLLDGKVDKVSGKGLSTNDYDNTAKGIVDGVTAALADKVDKETGKGLSTNDYTTAEKNKVATIDNKADKVSSATNGNLAGLNGSGNLTDSGWNGAKDTTPISGNPISISGLKANQLAINPIITLEPIQDLHGQSKPYPAGGGKNLIPMTVDSIKAANTAGTWSGNAYTYNGVTVTIITDNANNIIEFKVNGTCTGGSWAFVLTSAIPVSSGSYYINGNGSSATARLRYKNGSDWAYTNTTGSTDTPITLDSAYNLLVDIYIPNSTTFTNLLLHPMIRLSTVSDATFAPYSNICPISGYDKIEVLSCGKNLFDKDNLLLGIVIAGGTINTSNETWRRCYFPVVPNTNYCINVLGYSTFTGYTYATYDKDGVWLETFANIGSVPATITTGSNVYYIAWNCNTSNAGVTQIEEGNQATAYQPYNKTTSISESLGQTVYHAIDNVRSGKIDVDSADYTLTGSETWTAWGTGAYYSSCLTKNAPSTQGTVNVFACEFAEPKTVTNIYSGVSGIAVANNNIYISGDIYANISSLTGKKLIYEIATHSLIQLTPYEIPLLKDYAYLSTNGTSIALDYHNGELASLADVSQLGETVNELGEYFNAKIKYDSATGITDSQGILAFGAKGRLSERFVIGAHDGTGRHIFIPFVYDTQWGAKVLSSANGNPVTGTSITAQFAYIDLTLK